MTNNAFLAGFLDELEKEALVPPSRAGEAIANRQLMTMVQAYPEKSLRKFREGAMFLARSLPDVLTREGTRKLVASAQKNYPKGRFLSSTEFTNATKAFTSMDKGTWGREFNERMRKSPGLA